VANGGGEDRAGEVGAGEAGAGAEVAEAHAAAAAPAPALPGEGRHPVARVVLERRGLPPRRLRADLWRAGLTAERVLEEAHLEAGRIRALALDELEAWRAEAAAAGREEGLREGRARAAALVLETERRRDEALRQADGLVIDLAVALARRITLEALRAEPGAVAAAVEEALRTARGRRRAVVRLHPAGAAALRAQAGRLAEAAALASVEVVADPSLEPADVLVESECGLVDGRLEVRLAALRRAVEAA